MKHLKCTLDKPWHSRRTCRADPGSASGSNDCADYPDACASGRDSAPGNHQLGRKQHASMARPRRTRPRLMNICDTLNGKAMQGQNGRSGPILRPDSAGQSYSSGFAQCGDDASWSGGEVNREENYKATSRSWTSAASEQNPDGEGFAAFGRVIKGMTSSRRSKLCPPRARR